MKNDPSTDHNTDRGATQPWCPADVEAAEEAENARIMALHIVRWRWQHPILEEDLAHRERERELIDQGYQLGRDSLVALLPQHWMLALRTGPDKHGLGEYTVQIDGLTICVIPSRNGTGYADPEAELAAWRALVACVRRIMARPRPATADGVIPLPNTDAEFPDQLATATWITDEGDEIVLRHPRRTSRQIRAFRRRTRPGLSTTLPFAGLVAVKVALALAGAVVVIAGVATLPPGNVTSLTPPRSAAATSAARDHYVAPAPTRLAADASAPEPRQPIRDPADAPSPSPTVYPGRLPAGPTVTPTPTPTAVPSVVPTTVTPTAPPTVPPTVLTLAAP